ncbi:sensor histidine kinase [Breznakia pachnodae]|uniref:histidine kinase n=1 Tax=Breznakia pachnodae TaxID=265178 RepID=A0ABU0E555_9FIRM|nr:HAMP domain-containing sensor histidine kinase [Breznakia pachnodae]MDQ0362043.1 signal transduction histidine kinase [Breznakia pachnodae]
MKKSINEINVELMDHLENESNALISISSNDKTIKQFTNELNKQLRLLRKQRQQYLNGNIQLKDSVTNISHDLRTPLTAISGYLDLLEEENKSSEVERYIGIISNRVEMMKQLTEELFRYSVVINSESPQERESVILNNALEESIAQFYVELKERDIDPVIRMDKIKITRYLNASMLSRVLSNLLSNAIKYSDGDLEIKLTETGEIVITNTASTLNQIQVAQLFDRYYTLNTAENSTGLGLGITKELVSKMNGTIMASYEHNKLSISVSFLNEDD